MSNTEIYSLNWIAIDLNGTVNKIKQCKDIYYFLNVTFGGSLASPKWLLLAFLPENLGRWWGPMNNTFALI